MMYKPLKTKPLKLVVHRATTAPQKVAIRIYIISPMLRQVLSVVLLYQMARLLILILYSQVAVHI